MELSHVFVALVAAALALDGFRVSALPRTDNPFAVQYDHESSMARGQRVACYHERNRVRRALDWWVVALLVAAAIAGAAEWSLA